MLGGGKRYDTRASLKCGLAFEIQNQTESMEEDESISEA